jgi:hypothetical protein
MARQVDTSEVFKQPVHCFRCDEAFYFTLRAIAEDEQLKCPVCGTGINLSNDGYKSLVASVRYTILSENIRRQERQRVAIEVLAI